MTKIACRRRSRISRPLKGCVADVPFLALRTCRVAVLKFTCPRQIHRLGGSEAMPIGQEHHQGVTRVVPVGIGRLDQLLDLVSGRMLASAQLGIRGALRVDCSFFSGWRYEARVQFGHDLRASPIATVLRIGIL
jgi:hypothetical protein